MARYKVIDTSPRFLSVDLSRQLLSDTFEQCAESSARSRTRLFGLDAPSCNKLTGATGYPLANGGTASGLIASRCGEKINSHLRKQGAINWHPPMVEHLSFRHRQFVAVASRWFREMEA